MHGWDFQRVRHTGCLRAAGAALDHSFLLIPLVCSFKQPGLSPAFKSPTRYRPLSNLVNIQPAWGIQSVLKTRRIGVSAVNGNTEIFTEMSQQHIMMLSNIRTPPICNRNTGNTVEARWWSGSKDTVMREKGCPAQTSLTFDPCYIILMLKWWL